jgi:ADP-ribose pyrophosphatase YjhB (NUDIX family)
MIKQLAVFFLGFVDRDKPLGTVLFNAIARIHVTCALETMAFRGNSETGREQIYLTKRSSDEKSYPRFWHLPGTVQRPCETVEQSFKRLAEKEYNLPLLSWKCVGIFNNLREPRGHFFTVVFHVAVGEERGNGRWFNVDDLPEDMIDFHKNRLLREYASLDTQVYYSENS